MKHAARGSTSAFALACAWLLASCVTPQPEAKLALPSAVADARQAYVDDCKPDAPVFTRALILQADLNGDGQDDYVLNGAAYRCRGDTPYCGSAGCETQILISAPGGLLEQHFSGHLQEPPRIVRRNGKPALVSGAGRSAFIFDARAMRFAPAQR